MIRIRGRCRPLTRHTLLPRAIRVGVGLSTAGMVLSLPGIAEAATGEPSPLAVNDLPTVIANLQSWVMGILAAVATLFLILGGVFRVTAGGDPSQVERANGYFKNALIGYGLAVLAPILLQVVQGIVGG